MLLTLLGNLNMFGGNVPPPPPSPSGGGGGGGGGPMGRLPDFDEYTEERKKKVMVDDANLISIFKIYLDRCQ